MYRSSKCIHFENQKLIHPPLHEIPTFAYSTCTTDYTFHTFHKQLTLGHTAVACYQSKRKVNTSWVYAKAYTTI